MVRELMARCSSGAGSAASRCLRFWLRCRHTREAIAADDVGKLRSAVDELSALTYKMTENLYAELGGEESE